MGFNSAFKGLKYGRIAFNNPRSTLTRNCTFAKL